MLRYQNQCLLLCITWKSYMVYMQRVIWNITISLNLDQNFHTLTEKFILMLSLSNIHFCDCNLVFVHLLLACFDAITMLCINALEFIENNPRSYRKGICSKLYPILCLESWLTLHKFAQQNDINLLQLPVLKRELYALSSKLWAWNTNGSQSK